MGSSIGQHKMVDPRYAHAIWNVPDCILNESPSTNNLLERLNRDIDKEIRSAVRLGQKMSLYGVLLVFKQRL